VEVSQGNETNKGRTYCEKSRKREKRDRMIAVKGSMQVKGRHSKQASNMDVSD